MYNICAIIPAFNEELFITSVIRQAKRHDIDIIVIDDGSHDQTSQLAEKEGVHLLRHTCNKGKGIALRHGFQLALEKGYDYIVTLDADGQHNPDEIPRFIAEISDSNADIIAGNRMRFPKDMPASRVFINRLFSRIVSTLSKQQIPDALCGYRVIKRGVLESVELNSGRYDIVPEVLIKASKKGFKIFSIDIKSIYRDERSDIRPLRDGFDFFKLVLKELKNK